jgi:hypothetical protein
MGVRTRGLGPSSNGGTSNSPPAVTRCGRRRSGPRCSRARHGSTRSIPAAGRARPLTFEPSIATRSLRSVRLCWVCDARGVRGRRRCPKPLGLSALPPATRADAAAL